jgi:hypothetical protein
MGIVQDLAYGALFADRCPGWPDPRLLGSGCVMDPSLPSTLCAAVSQPSSAPLQHLSAGRALAVLLGHPDPLKELSFQSLGRRQGHGASEHAVAERPEHRSAPKGAEVRRARSGSRCSTPMAMPVEDVEGWNRGFFCGVIGTSNRFLRGRSDGDPTWLAPLAALGGDGSGARHGMHIPKRARAQSEPDGGPGSRVAVRDLPGHPARASGPGAGNGQEGDQGRKQ